MEEIELSADVLKFGDGSPLPEDIEHLLEEAESRRVTFLSGVDAKRIPLFVASNYPVVYRALRQIAQRSLAVGPAFCEWGSGMGIVTCLAARLGFDSVGIEIDPRLIDSARRFAADFAPTARFHEGSYQPDGLFTETLVADQLDRGLGCSPTAFDLIYVYPWPAEERAAVRLFTDFGRINSLLLSYHGRSTMRLRRLAPQPALPGWFGIRRPGPAAPAQPTG